MAKNKPEFQLVRRLIVLFCVGIGGLLGGVAEVTAQTDLSCKADISQDGIVDILDYSILANNFLSQNPNPPRSDISQDGIVDILDYSILANNFLKTPTNCQPTSTATPTAGTTIDIYAVSVGTAVMELQINDQTVHSFSNFGGNYAAREFVKLTYRASQVVDVSQIKIAFNNDSGSNDLYIDKMVVNGIPYESESPTTYSTGVYTQGTCQYQGGYFKKEKLGCNGYFQYATTPTPNQTTIDIYAVSVGTAVLDLTVDDQVVESFASIGGNYQNRQFIKLTHVVNQLIDVSRIKLSFSNDSYSNDLFIDKIVVNGQEFQSEAATTYSTGVFDNGTCQSQGGFFKTEKLGCNGYFLYDQDLSSAPTPVPTIGATSTPSPTSTSSVGPTPNPTATPIVTLPPVGGGHSNNSLAGAAAKYNMTMGTAIKWSAVTNNEQDYLSTLSREYNYVVAENEFKPKAISNAQNNLRFSTTDAFVNWAESYGFVIGAHTLVWHHNVPNWLETGSYSNSFVETWLENYIKTVVGRYRGRIHKWDVVNEAVYYSHSKGTIRMRTDSFWHQKIGPDYIEKAFRWAHQADPNAKLYINEYSTEWGNPKTDLLYTVVKDLKDKGVPIHGVGFQVHQHVDTSASYNQIYSSMKRFTDLGLEVEVTELDVAIVLPADSTELSKQAQIYKNVVAACRALAKCTGVTSWGFTDKYSWINSSNSAGGNSGEGNGAALPFDASYNKKPAYHSMMEALK